MRDTKAVGDISTAMVTAALLKARKNVLVPFGDRHRYDLVIEENGVYTRIQCKTGRLIGESIKFNLYSVVRDAATKKWIKKPYRDDVDAYGVYCPQTGHSYLVPAARVGIGEGVLRLTPGRSGVKLAQDFLIKEAT
jgi:hypothetical protein